MVRQRRRALGYLLVAGLLMAVALPARPASGAGEVGRIRDRLLRLKGQVRSLAVTEEVVVRDERPGEPAREEVRTSRVAFRADLARVRRETATAGAGAAGDARIAQSTDPFPAWLFGLTESLRSDRCRVTGTADGLAVVLASPRGAALGGRAARAEVDRDGLPVRLTTFGAAGERLDEAEVRWQTVGGIRVPAEVTTRSFSAANTLIRIVRYRDVRVNPVLSASLFGAP